MDVQEKLEEILRKFEVVPAANGFIDLIVVSDRVVELIDAVTELGVIVSDLSFWCHFIEERKITPDCPHGYGGPRNDFGTGRFSECVQYEPPEFELLERFNRILTPEKAREKTAPVRRYLQQDFRDEKFWSPCLRVGLWLEVPKSWKRKFYKPENDTGYFIDKNRQIIGPDGHIGLSMNDDNYLVREGVQIDVYVEDGHFYQCGRKLLSFFLHVCSPTGHELRPDGKIVGRSDILPWTSR